MEIFLRHERCDSIYGRWRGVCTLVIAEHSLKVAWIVVLKVLPREGVSPRDRVAHSSDADAAWQGEL